jgi:hypothetical protein
MLVPQVAKATQQRPRWWHLLMMMVTLNALQRTMAMRARL